MEDIIDIIVTETTNTIEITSQATDEIIDVNIIDNREDVTLNVTPSLVEININSLTGNFGVEWGDITGTLADQTDLQTVLDAKADLVGGKVPSSQLPSYVDDIVEVANYAALPATGETGKIYVVLDTNKIYRWSGSAYIEIADSTAVWGAITGTLSNQTDLQSALDAKFDDPTGDTTQYIAGDGSLITFPVAGQSGTLVREVRNTTGYTLTKGTIVYISGATGNKPTVSKAIATGDSTSAQTFGMCQADISNNSNGYVVCVGDLSGLDTSGLSEGAQLYLSSTTAGTYTTTKQLAPAHLVYIGIVTRAHPTLGQIEVKIQNGYELDEIHDVAISSKSNNDGLFYEASTDLWKNKSIATVLGYTPMPTITFNSPLFIGSGGDVTIPLATTSANGYLSSTDWNTFNNKANDSLVVHLAGTETITGLKTFSGGLIADVSTGGDQGFASTNSSTSATSVFVQNNSTGIGILANNASTGDAILIGNDTSGRGIYIINATISGSGKGISIDNYNSGIGIEVGSDSSEDAIKVLHLAGRGLNIQSSGGGYGLIINNTTASTSAPFTIQKQGVTKVSFTDAGAATFAGALSGTSATFTTTSSVPLTVATTLGNSGIIIKTSSSTYNWLLGAQYTLGNGFEITPSTAVGGTTFTNPVFSILSSGAATFSSSVTAAILSSRYHTMPSGTGFNAFEMGNDNTVGGWYIYDNTNGAYRIVLKNNGNVGIGTTSPSVKLHIQNSGENLRLQGVSSGNAVFQTWFDYVGNRRGYIGYGTGGSSQLDFSNEENGAMTFLTNSTERMRITSAGNVGIGTSSPDSFFSSARNLVVGTGSGNNGMTIFSGSAAVGDIAFADATTDPAFYSGLIRYDHSLDAMRFFTASSERMRITSAGNVGIGSTTASGFTRTLKINTASGTAGILLADGDTDRAGFYVDSGTTAPAYLFTNDSKPLVLSVAGVERMRITSAGYIGINSSTVPQGQVYINGGTANSDVLSLQNSISATPGAYIVIADNNTPTWANAPRLGAITNDMVFKTVATERMRITSGGYLKASNDGSYYTASGVGHELRSSGSGDWNTIMTSTGASPYGLLIGLNPNISNTGNEFISAYVANFSNLRFKVASNGGIYNFQANDSNLSDKRTKKEISSLESYWDKFKALDIVKFKYKDQSHDDFNIGVIAQQVESVAPEFVNDEGWGETPEDGIPLKSVYSTDLYHASIGVLKEAMAKIETLEAKIKTLENK